MTGTHVVVLIVAMLAAGVVLTITGHEDAAAICVLALFILFGTL